MSFLLPLISTPVAHGRPSHRGIQPTNPPKAPQHAHAEGILRDSHGRVIHDLRLSITDRCNFRCVYCMDPGVRFFGGQEVLTRGEMRTVVRVCAGLGIRKLRLTGGEPTLHPELEEIIRDAAAVPNLEIALTTNGSLLEQSVLERWKQAGLSRITISIDAVDAGRAAEITRSKVPIGRVIEGIRAAVAAGLAPIKLNAVVIRGLNEDQVVPLARLAHDLGVEMRFIEFMPLDSSHAWDRTRVVSADEVIARIGEQIELVPLGRDDPSSTSETFAFADGSPGRIGVIAPVSRPFCGACSRLRITADGKVRPCLFSTVEWDVRPLLRRGPTDGGPATDQDIRAFIIDSVWTKQAGHGISTPTFEQPERPMSAIGG